MPARLKAAMLVPVLNVACTLSRLMFHLPTQTIAAMMRTANASNTIGAMPGDLFDAGAATSAITSTIASTIATSRSCRDPDRNLVTKFISFTTLYSMTPEMVPGRPGPSSASYKCKPRMLNAVIGARMSGHEKDLALAGGI